MSVVCGALGVVPFPRRATFFKFLRPVVLRGLEAGVVELLVCFVMVKMSKDELDGHEKLYG